MTLFIIIEWFTNQGFAGIMCMVFIVLFVYAMIINEKNNEDWKKIANRMNDNEMKRIEIDTKITITIEKHGSVLDELKRILSK